jgi:hypothetical protein
MLRRYTASLFAQKTQITSPNSHNPIRPYSDHTDKTIHALKHEVKALEYKLHHARKKIYDMNALVNEHHPEIFNNKLQKMIDEELKEHHHTPEEEHKLLIETKTAILNTKKDYLLTLEGERNNTAATLKLLDEEIKLHLRDIEELTEEVKILYMSDNAEEAKHIMENPALKEFTLRPHR